MTKLEQALDNLQVLITDFYLQSPNVTTKDFCHQLDVLELLRKTLNISSL